MAGIPPTLDSDAEDVVWALQTADALWKRSERADSIVWLRRAAQSAGEVEQDDRALELARSAAELSDLIAREPGPPTASAAPPPTAGVDELLDVVIDSSDLVSAPPSEAPVVPPMQRQMGTAPMAFAPVKLPAPAPAAPAPPREATGTAPLPPALATSPAMPVKVPPMPRPPTVDKPPPPVPVAAEAKKDRSEPPPVPVAAEAKKDKSEPPPVVAESRKDRSEPPLVLSSVSSAPSEVKSAAEAHAGMLDPWANAEPPPLPKLPAISSAPIPVSTTSTAESFDDDDEVVTSVKDLQTKPPKRATPSQAPPVPPMRPPAPTLPAVHSVLTEAARADAPPPQAPPSAEAALPIVQAFKAPEADNPFGAEAVTAPSPVAPAPAPPAAPAPPTPAAPVVIPAPEPTLVSATSEPKPAEPAPSPAAAVTVVPRVSTAELEAFEAFSDVPDDAREGLAHSAALHVLAKDEEVTGFSLAVILEGEVDVAAMIVDVPAERLAKGRVLKPSGTLHEGVPLRLICASATARVATWEAKDIAATFKSCPWVEEDLQSHADRILALVGVTMGPMVERLDESIRAQITSRLTVRAIAEGDELVHLGAPVRELVLVGQGVIELLDAGGVAVGSVGTGEIVFGAEVVSGGKASATARAGKGGALILAVDRGVAQELIVTLPPLLELLVRM